jgi:hypothetical protein
MASENNPAAAELIKLGLAPTLIFSSAVWVLVLTLAWSFLGYFVPEGLWLIAVNILALISIMWLGLWGFKDGLQTLGVPSLISWLVTGGLGLSGLLVRAIIVTVLGVVFE